jgi:Spy/CpxP family protein refolding chaperone
MTKENMPMTKIISALALLAAVSLSTSALAADSFSRPSAAAAGKPKAAQVQASNMYALGVFKHRQEW